MSSWLVALRIARREARRARGRSALVMALIALPVLGLSFAAVSYDSFRLTTAQQLDRELGAADALLRWERAGPVTQPPDGRGFASVTTGSGGGTGDPEVTEAGLRALLPAGSRMVPLRSGEIELRTATGVGQLAAEWLDLTDPVHAGRVVLRDGRAPAASDETALTRLAAGRLGAGLGDSMSTADGSGSWTVVGIVEYPERFREAVLLPPPAEAAPPRDWLVATPAPVTWEQVRRLNQHGIVVRSRAVLLDPPPPEQVPGGQSSSGGPAAGPALTIGVLVVGLALLEVVLLAGPAFAVGVRRRQRELALVAANGAAPKHQRRIVLAEGLVLGLAAAAAGIGLGVVAAVAGLPLLEEHQFARRAGGLRLWPAALAGIASVAVLAGVLAALIPAAVAARQDVRLALTGRRGVIRAKRRWLVLGLALTGVGAAVAAAGGRQADAGVLLAGLVAGQLGLVLCTPALVGLVGRAGRFLPLAPRVALRDTARNRAATAPAIAAVLAAVAGSLALGTFLGSDAARGYGQYRSSLPAGAVHVSYQVGDGTTRLPAAARAEVPAALSNHLPVTQVIEVLAPACPAGVEPATECDASVRMPPENECPYRLGARELTAAEQRAARADPRCDGTYFSGYFLGTVVDDGRLLQALAGRSADRDEAAATAALRAGAVVVTDPRLMRDGQVTVEVRQGEAGVEVTAPGQLAAGEQDPFTVFLPPRVLADGGLVAEPAGMVATTSTMPTQAQQDALAGALATIHPGLEAYVERGAPGSGGEDPTLVILAIAAGVITLGAAGIATGLAAADRRPDLATLGAVGASPRVRRLLSLSQSGVIAGLGGLLGTVAGLGTGVAVLVALNRQFATSWPPDPPYPLVMPWSSVAILLVAVPAVAMLGAGLLTRSRLPIERRR